MDPNAAPAPLFTSDSVANALGWVAAVLYLFGLVTVILRRRHGKTASEGLLDHLPALVGFVAHGSAIVLRAVHLKRLPLANLQESAIFLSFLLAVSYLVAAVRFRFPAVEVLLLSCVVAFL